MKSIIYFIIFAVFFVIDDSNLHAKYNQTESLKTDSDKYFNEILEIQDINAIRQDQIINLKNLSSETYKTLANIILINYLNNQNNENSFKTIEEIFQSTINFKINKILKDYVTILYGKTLLTQINLQKFKEHILPIIDNNDFNFKESGLELKQLYFILNKENNKIDISNLKSENAILQNNIKRIKILSIESKK